MGNLEDLTAQLNKLLQEVDLTSLTARQQLDHVAQIIDLACDTSSESAIIHAQQLIGKFNKESFSPEENTELLYFMANAWGALARIRNSNEPSFKWEMEEFEGEIVSLRQSLKSAGYENTSDGRKIQILTNLGSRLSEIGRPIEALRIYDLALNIFSRFGMALGGKGVCLSKYAEHLYDHGHSVVLLQSALDLLEKAALAETTDAHARDYFGYMANEIGKDYSKPIEIDFDERDLGSSKLEQEYRSWCREERFFLNPLNDLGTHPLALRDIFGMPSITVKVDELDRASGSPPKFFKYYNTLKQEYVSARFLFFEGIKLEKAHFSDKNVLIYNTLDYSSHSLSMEKIKLAYRSAYSLLDKVSFFLKEYFKIDMADDKVYFKSIWYKNGDRKAGLRTVFSDSENWPLRGLFWLSKDLFERSVDFKSSIDPDAEHLYELRNNMEHRFFNLHQMKVRDTGLSPLDYLKLQEDELISKTRSIFRTAREALIYLSLAINVEEEKKRKKSTGFTAPMDITVYEDEWKKKW